MILAGKASKIYPTVSTLGLYSGHWSYNTGNLGTIHWSYNNGNVRII